MKPYVYPAARLIVLTSLTACGVSSDTDTTPAENTSNQPVDSGTETDTGTDTGDETFQREAISGQQSFTHDGIERTYYLHIPQNAAAHAPLVLVMHGYTGSATGIMEYSGMNDVADEHGFAVFYPQGTRDQSGNPFFNVGYQFHVDEGVRIDDMGFIGSLVAHLQETYTLSTDNVFSTGMSNGGDMSYRLGCQASDVFKAIAPVAGTMLNDVFQDCTPTRPMPVFEIHGTRDDVTYWEGDMANADGWGAYLDIDSIVTFWVDYNGLDQHTTEELADTSGWDESTVVFERYYSDVTASEVWLYRIEEGGHDWPGAWGNQDIDASQAVWSFFSQYVD